MAHGISNLAEVTKIAYFDRQQADFVLLPTGASRSLRVVTVFVTEEWVVVAHGADGEGLEDPTTGYELRGREAWC